MTPLRQFAPEAARQIDFVLCDFDDTLTYEGKFSAVSMAGMERLRAAGKKVIVVTGRPAGWCDLMARFFPVDGVVGENGAFYFRYLAARNHMVREFCYSEVKRARDKTKLFGFLKQIRKAHPKLRLSADQPFRVSDIAVDICEDVNSLTKSEVEDIVARFEKLGATVKVSSIHINAWIGKFDKLSMIQTLLANEFGLSATAVKKNALYIGDSPNDEPMFAFFTYSVGVKNIETFSAGMVALPQFVTKAPGGRGFLEVANLLVGESASAFSHRRGRSHRSSSPRRG